MPRLSVPVLGLTTVAALVPAGANAATITTDRPCYYERQATTITGAGWGPGTRWNAAADQIFAAGDADPAGNWTTQVQAPILTREGISPKAVTLTGTQDGVAVATTNFQVVNFLVQPKATHGKPTRSTTWAFSGFEPGKRIYVHIRRGSHTYTEKAGRGDGTCGTLRTRLRRLPAVPASQIRKGRYGVFVDTRRAFRKGGHQFPARITVF